MIPSDSILTVDLFFIEFLRLLEEQIPPKPKSHHMITYAQYGSDENGWEDKLALQLNEDDGYRCYFFEKHDFLLSPDELASEIVKRHTASKNDPKIQMGVGPGQYSK